MMNNSDFVNIEVEYKKQGMWIKSVKHRLNSTISSIPLNQLKPGVRNRLYIDFAEKFPRCSIFREVIK